MCRIDPHSRWCCMKRIQGNMKILFNSCWDIWVLKWRIELLPYWPVCLGPQVCVFHVWEEWAGLGQVEDYLSVLEYLLWVFTPLAIVFILPFLIVILLYLSILFLHVYKVHRHYPSSARCEEWTGVHQSELISNDFSALNSVSGTEGTKSATSGFPYNI